MIKFLKSLRTVKYENPVKYFIHLQPANLKQTYKVFLQKMQDHALFNEELYQNAKSVEYI